MPDTINDGGPAFPVHPSTNPAGEAAGMSLRDWFAGQAINGFAAATANESLPMEAGESIDAALSRFWAVKAQVAYRIADAMIAAREAR